VLVNGVGVGVRILQSTDLLPDFANNIREGEMAKLTTFLATGLSVLVLWGLPCRAAPLPDRAVGVWSVVDCGGDGLTILVNSSAALMIESEGKKARVAIAAAEWAGGSFVLTAQGDMSEVILPPLDSLKRCDFLPSSFAFPFAEAVAVFKELGHMDEHCKGEGGITPQCVAVAFEIVDITGDGRFSRAELSRMIRAASFFIVHRLIADKRQVAFVPLEELYLAQLAVATFGPLVATNLIDSYDFDGDGFLSPKELLQDRKPEEGLEGAAASLATELSPAVMSALMKSASGILDLLR